MQRSALVAGAESGVTWALLVITSVATPYIYIAGSILLRFILIDIIYFTILLCVFSILRLSIYYLLKVKPFCIKLAKLLNCYNLLFKNLKKYIIYT